MSYQALYRSWRPKTFEDFVGQPHVKQTLTNAILRNQVAHAYLFSGPRGTGKTSAAKVLAKAVNCLSPIGVEPCNECTACKSINAGNNVDVEEIDAASNRGVDEIRQLRDKVQYAPATLRRKVYIVDEVHMLTTEAFNALLKTLEEPPGHTLFVLATTEPHKIPATIVSRCQRFDFRRISPEVMVERLESVCHAQGWHVEGDALWKVAEAADGGLRDALGLLEQTAAFGQGHITEDNAAHVMGGVATTSLLQLVRALVDKEALQAMELLMDWYATGKDATRIVHDILQLLRDLFIVKLSRDTGHVSRTGYVETAQACDADWLLMAVHKLGETYMNLRYVDQPRLALEAALLGLVYVQPQFVAQAAPGPTGQPAATGASRVRQGGRQESTKTAEVASVASAETGNGEPDGVSAKPTGTASGSRGTKGRAPAGNASRKLEVLRNLYNDSSAQALQEMHARWDEILHLVKSRRIQTHAWLINGEVVLATLDTAVMAFSSRIHRDAVMKGEERETIEAAFAEILGREVRVLALLQSDWETFTKSVSASADESTSAESPDNDLVDRAVQLFGKDTVEIQD